MNLSRVTKNATEPPGDIRRAVRVAQLQRRAAAGLSLFEPTPAPRAVDRPQCWCCGLAGPHPKSLRARGWAVRWLTIDRFDVSEIYCPECFKTWGWPNGGTGDGG